MGRRPLVIVFIALIIVVLLMGVNIDDEKYVEEKNTHISGVVYSITVSKNSYVLWVHTEQYNNMPVYVSDIDDAGIRVGNTIEAVGDIHSYEKAVNDGGFDLRKYYYYNDRITCYMYAKEVDITDNNVYVIRNCLYRIRCSLCRMTEKVYDEKDAGIIKAMLFGDKSSLDKDIKESYQTGGISHVLAISGLHVSIIGIMLYSVIYKVTSSVNFSTITTILLIFMYGLLTGFSVSTNRAVVMMIIMMIAKMIGRTYDMASAICLSGIIVIMINPYQIYQAGALLSFLAVTAVCVLLPVVYHNTGFCPDDAVYMKELKKNGDSFARHGTYPLLRRIYRNTIKTVSVSFVVSLVTLPVILYNYFEYMPLSLIGNLIVIPLMTIVVTMALISVFVAYVSVRTGIFLSGCVHYILKLYEVICSLCDGKHVKSFLTGRPDFGKIAVFYFGLVLVCVSFAFLKKRTNRKLTLWFLTMLVACTLVFYPVNDGKLHVDMLDVGQGDGIVIRTPLGQTILVDAGSSSKDKVGKDIIEKYLKYHGIRNIDYVIVSHPDNDHISGIMEVINRGKCDIKHIILPGICLQDDGYDKLRSLAVSKNIKVEYLNSNMTFEPEKNLKMIVLHPDKDLIWDDRNDYSLTFLLKYREFSMIFTGDISADQEKLISDYAEKTGTNLDVDVYKCAHHGSAFSSSEDFLDMIMPEYTLISAGKNNMYHHPSDSTLERLEDVKSKVFVTFNTGQISVSSDGSKEGLSIKTALYDE